MAAAPPAPPRSPKARAQASAAPGVQIEPITGASAASWAEVCTSGVVAITPAVTARSSSANAPRDTASRPR